MQSGHMRYGSHESFNAHLAMPASFAQLPTNESMPVCLQVPVAEVMKTYRLEKAVVQGLQGDAGKYAWRLITFCNRMGYNDMEVLLSRFQVWPLPTRWPFMPFQKPYTMKHPSSERSCSRGSRCGLAHTPALCALLGLTRR